MKQSQYISACNEYQHVIMLRKARQLRLWIYVSSPWMVVLLLLGQSSWGEKIWLGFLFGAFNLALYGIIRLTESAQAAPRPTNTGLDVLAYIEH